MTDISEEALLAARKAIAENFYGEEDLATVALEAAVPILLKQWQKEQMERALAEWDSMGEIVYDKDVLKGDDE